MVVMSILKKNVYPKFFLLVRFEESLNMNAQTLHLVLIFSDQDQPVCYSHCKLIRGSMQDREP